MFKKNSWIVALLLALTLTALFTGCIDALEEEDNSGITYTEVELGDFNVWGGQNYQRGWSVAGLKFLGVGDKPEVAADKGYKNEDFAKATKLVIEMEDATHPSGNLDIIWGAADKDGESVGKDWVQNGGIKFTKEGNVITIDLTTALKDYAQYRDPSFAKRKIILQAGGESAGLTKLVVKAKLLIPDKEEPLPPDLTIIPGGGYKVPKATAPDIYVDLNLAKIGALNPASNIPKALIGEDDLTVEFDWNTQNIFIAFDDDTKNTIVSAAKNSYTFDVTITGTQGGHLRWCLGADRTGSWNQTGWGGNGTADSFNAVKNLVPSGNDVFGVVIQARPTGNADSVAIATPYEVIIESIKITPKAPVNAITSMNISLPAPSAGFSATKTVSGTGYNGTVTWFPSLSSNGKYAVSTVYYAQIVLSPAANYYFTAFTPGVNSGTPGTNVLSYDAVTKTVITTNFTKTADTIPDLPLGIVWSLEEQDWFIAGTAPSEGWWNVRPLQFNTDGSKLTVEAGASITVPDDARPNGWDGFDFFAGGQTGGLGLDPTTYKLKVTVKGEITNSKAGVKFQVQESGGSYVTFIEETLSTTVGDKFDYSGEIPENFDINGRQMRIHPDTAAYGFKLTNLIIENLGKR